jgi:hypothetical protein
MLRFKHGFVSQEHLVLCSKQFDFGGNSMSTFGLNILPRYNRGRLLDLISKLKPGACVVMDDYDLAVDIKQQHPSTEVIFRAWNSKDGNYHNDIKPEQWYETHRRFGENDIVVQVLNEPSGSDNLPQLAKWCAEIMKLADQDGIRLALPNFGMGNPDENKLANGEIDPLFLAFNRSPNHILTLHEYTHKKPSEVPWLIGRFKNVVKRLHQLEVEIPQIVITEFGHDIGGGHGDGYKNHMTSEEYAAFMRDAGPIYSKAGIFVCVYCAGPGYGWESFDVLGDDIVENAMIAFNQMQTEAAQPLSP